MRKKLARPQGSIRMELLRKATHAITGVLVVLLVQARILDLTLLGLATLVLAVVVLFNLRYEKELLMRILSINRPDARVPGLDIIAYLFGMWLVLLIFPPNVAYAAILITAFGDPLAHLVGRSFGATQTVVVQYSHWYGMAAGTFAGTLAAWLPGYAPLLPALIASGSAMFVEAGEVRIAEHRIDDNLTIPIVSGFVLWVISNAFPF